MEKSSIKSCACISRISSTIAMKLPAFLLSLVPIGFLALSVLRPAVSLAVDSPIYDTDGDEVIAGQSYYVLPETPGSAGGLTLGSRNGECPLFVHQDSSVNEKGVPVIFKPLNGSAGGAVLESTRLHIEFKVAATICIQGTSWTVIGEEDKDYLFAGGGEASTFVIQDVAGGGYKFVDCPVCTHCHPGPVCRSVGTILENGNRRLALIPADPLTVVFEKTISGDGSLTSSH